MRDLTYKLIASVITLLVSLTAYAGVCDREITFGWEDWKPYQYEDTNKKLTGLDIELVTNILKDMGCQVKYVSLPWSRHLKELEKGKVDLAAAASKNDERQVYAFFSDGYRKEQASLFVTAEKVNSVKLDSLKDIIGAKFKLGVDRAYYYGPDYEELIKNADFKRLVSDVTGMEPNVKKVLSGRIDGFLGDPVAVVDYLKENKLTDKIVRHPVKIYADDVHVMVSKSSLSPEFVKALNDSLASLRQNGKYQQIIDAYLK